MLMSGIGLPLRHLFSYYNRSNLQAKQDSSYGRNDKKTDLKYLSDTA